MTAQLKKLILLVTLMAPTFFATATSLVFDLVTSYEAGSGNFLGSRLTGIARDTGVNLDIQFKQDPSVPCTTLILTAMEKSGRYYLHFNRSDIEPWYVASCKLELKVQPQ